MNPRSSLVHPSSRFAPFVRFGAVALLATGYWSILVAGLPAANADGTPPTVASVASLAQRPAPVLARASAAPSTRDAVGSPRARATGLGQGPARGGHEAPGAGTAKATVGTGDRWVRCAVAEVWVTPSPDQVVITTGVEYVNLGRDQTFAEATVAAGTAGRSVPTPDDQLRLPTGTAFVSVEDAALGTTQAADRRSAERARRDARVAGYRPCTAPSTGTRRSATRSGRSLE